MLLAIIHEKEITELLRTSPAGGLFHRENQELEFKEQFNLAGLADYFKDFAAFANNKGGCLIFGISDSPRQLTGLLKSAIEQFEKIDPEKITGFLLDIFSGNISWEAAMITHKGMTFGVFKISQAITKPMSLKRMRGKIK